MSVPWRGASGQVYYTSDPYKLSSGLPSQPGVYIICKFTSSTGLGAIYVGECEDFNDRLYLKRRSHHQYSCFVRNGATHVCLLPVQQARLPIETDLRNGLNPPCNQQ
jgi:hypothetical protein